MGSAWRERLATATGLHLLGLAALSLAVVLRLDPWREPILGDRAYFIYLGQAILRGEPIYANSFFGYPPLTPLLSAGAMWIGRQLGVASYLAPRFAGIAVYVGCVLLSYTIARRATASAGAGALAGVVMAGFALFGALSVANLEPKILLIFFSLAASTALQHGRWGLAGLACGLAGMCWQPAILVAAAIFASLFWGAGPRRARAVALYALGMAAALLPAAAYLWASDGFGDFWQRAIVLPATVQGSGPPSGSWWLTVARFYWPSDRPFLMAAAAGFALFALRAARQGPRALAAAFCSPSLAAMPLLAPLWVSWNTFDFQGPPDLLPLLTVVPFWTAWLAHELFRLLERWPKVGRPVAALLGIVIAGHALGDVLLHRPGITLTQEREILAEILSPVLPGEEIVSFDAPELYVLSERPSPMGFLDLNAGFVQAMQHAYPDGCQGVRRRLEMLRARVVVILDHPFPSRCVRTIGRELTGRRYRKREVSVPWWRHRSYDPDDAEPDALRWVVYTSR